MNDVSLKNNWKNNTLHTFFGLAVSWLFVFSVSRSLKIYFDIEVGALTFLFIVVVLTLFLYFLLYCKRPTVINDWWIAAGIIASLLSCLGVINIAYFFTNFYADNLSLNSEKFIYINSSTVINLYDIIWLIAPLIIYTLSFINKKAFLSLFYFVAFLAICGSPLLPIIICTLIF